MFTPPNARTCEFNTAKHKYSQNKQPYPRIPKQPRPTQPRPTQQTCCGKKWQTLACFWVFWVRPGRQPKKPRVFGFLGLFGVFFETMGGSGYNQECDVCRHEPDNPYPDTRTRVWVSGSGCPDHVVAKHSTLLCKHTTLLVVSRIPPLSRKKTQTTQTPKTLVFWFYPRPEPKQPTNTRVLHNNTNNNDYYYYYDYYYYCAVHSQLNR